MSVCKMHPGASGGGLTLGQGTKLSRDGARHCLGKGLTALVWNFEHQETEIFRVRYFLKNNGVIVWGIGCLVWGFSGGKRG